MNLNTSISSMVLLSMLAVVLTGCEKPSTAPDSAALIKDLDIKTATIGSALESMLAQEEYVERLGETPKQQFLDTYWMAFTSTTLDLKRLDALLVANPDIRTEARNMWIGRVQSKLMELQEDGMLTDMRGPITSRLGPAFGEERVANEGKKMLQLKQSIEKILDIKNPNEQ